MVLITFFLVTLLLASNTFCKLVQCFLIEPIIWTRSSKKSCSEKFGKNLWKTPIPQFLFSTKLQISRWLADKLRIKHWSFHENFPKKPKQFFHRKLVKAHSVLLKLNKSSPTGIGNLFLKKKSFVFSELRLLSSWFIFYDQSDGTCYKCYQYKRLLFIFYLHSWNFLSAASNIGFSFCLLGNSDCWRHAFCKNLLSI